VLAQARTRLGELAPEPRGLGAAGLGRWTTETRLPGRSGGLDDELVHQCVEVLAGLRAGDGGRGASLTAHARLVAAHAPDAERELLALAARLDDELAALPRVFAHGDFWAGNVLSADGRLTGIVDWDAGGSGRLPLLDLLHLLSAPSGPRTATPQPAAALELVWRRLDDSPAISDYCQRIGIERHRNLLRRLAVAFWLERAAWISERSVGAGDNAWAQRNVQGVLRFVANNDPL
jgi:aminoglycoside phosphotransferase (APT) family kinase protein